jgi:hypothetical protein
MANGIAGASNPCGSYFGPPETLNERLIREGLAVRVETPGRIAVDSEDSGEPAALPHLESLKNNKILKKK